MSLGSTQHSAWHRVRLNKVSSSCDCNVKTPLRALCGAKREGAAEGQNRCSSVRGLKGGARREAKDLEEQDVGPVAAKMPKKTGKEETSLLFLLCPGFLLDQLLPQVSPLKAGGLFVPSAMGPGALPLAEHGSCIQDLHLGLGLRALRAWFRLVQTGTMTLHDPRGLWGLSPFTAELASSLPPSTFFFILSFQALL